LSSLKGKVRGSKGHNKEEEKMEPTGTTFQLNKKEGGGKNTGGGGRGGGGGGGGGRFWGFGVGGVAVGGFVCVVGGGGDLCAVS